MVFLLGTDEAGYGPKLGPLCIAASAWQVPARAATTCLYDRLSAVVCSGPADSAAKLAIADSKCLYKSGGSMEQLERGVLTALACLDRLPRRWRDLWRALDGEALPQIDDCPWHDPWDELLPLIASVDELRQFAVVFSSGCAAAEVKLLELQSTVLFPAAFNRAVSGCDNKAEVLSLATLRLARRILEDLPPGHAIVFCDKHGGRNYYAALLQHVFPDNLVLARVESSALGVYEVRHAGRAIEFRFQPKGERHLPTALASMTAKYLRELAMRPFNAFWQRHLPDLKPTAGYSTDASRFYTAIRPTMQRLGISSAFLWRDR